MESRDGFLLALAFLFFPFNILPSADSNAGITNPYSAWIGENLSPIIGEVLQSFSSITIRKVELISPDDGEVVKPGNVSFVFFWNASEKANCSLFLNGQENETTTVNAYEMGNITISLSEGNYTWIVKCDDVYSEERTLFVYERYVTITILLENKDLSPITLKRVFVDEVPFLTKKETILPLQKKIVTLTFPDSTCHEGEFYHYLSLEFEKEGIIFNESFMLRKECT